MTAKTTFTPAEPEPYYPQTQVQPSTPLTGKLPDDPTRKLKKGEYSLNPPEHSLYDDYLYRPPNM